ncbi:Trafficking protein particle complex subunit 6B-like isoform X3 [Oopsacas minuta]|uniref:Trafficking protein particle complex subunit 6B-like isoform X3 n=1 Tax=Oopsacas minuta TaxID=111878 RepID=A0AAV7JZ26_9METZ|nr:Trafficking protein particle complex subunit 6B-like isoform X3 [Oopsacas minuta]
MAKAIQEREIGLDLFAFLHGEVYSFVTRTGTDPEQQSTKLRAMGIRAGQVLQERLNLEAPRTQDEVDIVRFVCRDVWTHLYLKQIDKLRTDNKGAYYLIDNEFCLIKQVSDSMQYLRDLPLFLEFTCGLIQGIFVQFGISAIVTPEVTHPPMCIFKVQIHNVK